jgi:hypothetical protein
VKKNLLVEMDAEVYKAFRASGSISQKNGNGVDLLKIGTKR